ncbi:MAG: alpha/beta hydrolase, partial [Tumebacillaceae bacterium]
MSLYPAIKPFSYRRKRNKWLRLSIALLILLVLSVPLISGFVGWSLTHPAHKPIEATPKSVGAAYQDVSFASTDGTTLRGWFLPAGDNSRVVVFAHGYRGNRADKPALPTAKQLVDSGISVLLFDFRNSGES